MRRIKRLVLERLMRYYRFLSESTDRKSAYAVTSAEIAQALDVDATQVRKDFAAIGILGMGHVGFEVCEVCRAIRNSLGFDTTYHAVLVGTGHLGSALLTYPGFIKYGLHIVAAFDNHPGKIGKRVAGFTIKPMREVSSFVTRRSIRLAIITTPAGVSQELTNRLVAAGVKAIWNFTPTQLVTPPDILVRSEHISRGLSEIAHHLKYGPSPGADDWHDLGADPVPRGASARSRPVRSIPDRPAARASRAAMRSSPSAHRSAGTRRPHTG